MNKLDLIKQCRCEFKYMGNWAQCGNLITQEDLLCDRCRKECSHDGEYTRMKGMEKSNAD